MSNDKVEIEVLLHYPDHIIFRAPTEEMAEMVLEGLRRTFRAHTTHVCPDEEESVNLYQHTPRRGWWRAGLKWQR